MYPVARPPRQLAPGESNLQRSLPNCTCPSPQKSDMHSRLENSRQLPSIIALA